MSAFKEDSDEELFLDKFLSTGDFVYLDFVFEGLGDTKGVLEISEEGNTSLGKSSDGDADSFRVTESGDVAGEGYIIFFSALN